MGIFFEQNISQSTCSILNCNISFESVKLLLSSLYTFFKNKLTVFILQSKQNMTLKNRFVNFYRENIQKGKSFIVKHFLAENIPKTTVYRLVKCAEQGESIERKVGSGRVVKIAIKKNIKRIERYFNHTSKKVWWRSSNVLKDTLGKFLKIKQT